MRDGVAFAERVELSILRPENRLVVENHSDRVVIRAVQRDLSPSQQSCLLRYLAAEGYIPERFQYFTESALEYHLDLRWVVDPCPQPRPFAQQNPLRRILYVILCAGVLWMALMALAITHALP